MGGWNQGRPWVTRVVFVSFLAFSVPYANATIITIGCANVGVACTLDELAGGASIQVNDVTFDTWICRRSFPTTPSIYASVDVVPLDDQPSNVGLAFAANGAMSTDGLDLIDIAINFAATTPAGAQQISGASFELTDFTFGGANTGGFIQGFEDVLDPSGGLIGAAFVEADNLPPPVFDLFDSTSFAPTSTLAIEKLLLIGGDGVGDTVTLDGFEQRFQFAAVPAPVPLILLFSGLLSLAWSRRTNRASTRESALIRGRRHDANSCSEPRILFHAVGMISGRSVSGARSLVMIKHSAGGVGRLDAYLVAESTTRSDLIFPRDVVRRWQLSLRRPIGRSAHLPTNTVQTRFRLQGTRRQQWLTSWVRTTTTSSKAARGDDLIDGLDGDDRITDVWGDNTINGGGGDDRILASQGEDVIDGGSGSDRIWARHGDDVVTYTLSENFGESDYYDGGHGTDTLRLVLTAEEAQDPTIQATIDAITAFVAGADPKSSGQPPTTFTFSIGGVDAELTLRNFEQVEVVVIDDGVSFSVSGPAFVTEGTDTFAVYTVTQSGTLGTGQSATVDYSTVVLGVGAGFATAGDDFTPVADSLDFIGTADGAQQQFQVAILDDAIVEGDEDFGVEITTASANAGIGTGTATTTIQDDDGVTFDVSGPAFVTEGTDTFAVYTVTQSGTLGAGQSASVDYSTVVLGIGAGFATAGDDFTPVADSLDFIGTADGAQQTIQGPDP